jgi:hypothetical protein
MTGSRMRRLMMPLLAASVASCGGQRSDSSEGNGEAQLPDTTVALPAESMPGTGQMVFSIPQAESDTVVTGVVASVGADPFMKIVLNAPDGSSVAVDGDLRGEIGQLVGAELRVWGPAEASAPPPPARAVNARGYEIVMLAGAKPMVGVLGPHGTTLITTSGDTVALMGVPEDLAANAGATVWVVGTEHDGGIGVQSYGVIRK